MCAYQTRTGVDYSSAHTYSKTSMFHINVSMSHKFQLYIHNIVQQISIISEWQNITPCFKSLHTTARFFLGTTRQVSFMGNNSISWQITMQCL